MYISYSDGEVGRYLHLKFEAVSVKVGASVEPGQYIAQSNATGEDITGAHLHYDHATNGRFVDPTLEFDWT